MSSADDSKGAQSVAPADVALDAWAAFALVQCIDEGRVEQARGAFDVLYARRLVDLARLGVVGPCTAAALEAHPDDRAVATAQTDLDEARDLLDLVADLLVPHVSLALLPELVHDRARWGSLDDYHRRSK